MPLTSYVQKRASTIALAIIVTCQLVVVLDATVVNIAFVSIQHSLHFSPAGLSWVVDAYGLAFGGLLLLGGRMGDVYGRRRMLTIGLTIFTGASLLGGLATSSTVLLLTRGVQGVGAALAAPSTLSLISATFEEGPRAQQGTWNLHRDVGRWWITRAHLGWSSHVVDFVAMSDVHQRAYRRCDYFARPTLRIRTTAQRRQTRCDWSGVGD